jgi:hypothetical protein
LLPGQLGKLTQYELMLLYWYKQREERREKYNLYINAWCSVPHDTGDEPESETETYPLPCDPGYDPKDYTEEKCKVVGIKTPDDS